MTDQDQAPTLPDPAAVPAAQGPAPPPADPPPPGRPPAAPPPLAAGGPPAPRHVYAIGRIGARFPSLGVEKEFAQATGRAQTAGLTDRESTHAVLSDPSNRYLARQLCWAMTIEGQDTYLLAPRDRADADMLIDAIRPTPTAADVDVVIGVIAGCPIPACAAA